MEALRTDPPVNPFEYDLNAGDRYQMDFGQVMTELDRITVRYRQPKIYP